MSLLRQPWPSALPTWSFFVLGLLFLQSIPAAEPYQFQTIDPLRENWRFTRYLNLQGHGLRCAVEDSQGNLWFGHREGVVCYDGYRWEWFGSDRGLSGEAVVSLTCRQNGDVIAASASGIHQWQDGGWSKLFPKNTSLAISFVAESPDGELWGCSPWGLIRLSKSTRTLYTSADYAEAAALLDQFDVVQQLPTECLPLNKHHAGTGIAHVRTMVTALSANSPARIAGIRPGDKLLRVQDNASPLSEALKQKSDQELSIRFERPSGKKELVRFITVEDMGNYHNPAMQSLLFDSQQRLWACTKARKLIMSTDQGETWRSWDRRDGVQLGPGASLAETSDGNVLLARGDHNEGVLLFQDDNWQGIDEGIKSARSVAQTMDSTIWVSNSADLYTLRNGIWSKNDPRGLKFPTDIRQMLTTSDGALWLIGYRQYAVRIAMSPKEFVTLSGARFLHREPSGIEWHLDTDARRLIRHTEQDSTSFGAEDGLMDDPRGVLTTPGKAVVAFGSHLNRASIATFSGSVWKRIELQDTSGDLRPRGSTVDRTGRIWIPTRRHSGRDRKGGIIVGSGDQWERWPTPRSQDIATVLALQNGEMLAVGESGVFGHDGNWKRLHNPLLREIDCQDGAVGTDGTVWLATKTKGLLRCRSGKWERFTTEDGLPSNDVLTVAVGDNDVVLAGTGNGLARFDGTRFYRYRQTRIPDDLGRRSISLVNDTIWIDGRRRITPDSTPPRLFIEAESIKVSTESPAMVSWKGVDRWDRTSPTELTWSYRLDEGDWSTFRRRSQIALRGLSPGTHVVHVRARDSDFNISEPSAPISILVVGPLWWRPWILVSICSIAAIFFWQTASWIERGMLLQKANDKLNAAQDSLRERFTEKSAQLGAVCDSSPVGILTVDTTGKITYTNQRLQEILGRSHDDLRSGTWPAMIHPDDRTAIESAWETMIRDQVTSPFSGRIVRDDDAVVWFNAQTARIEGTGLLHGYVCVLEDVTELKHAHEQVVKRERVSALGQMAAGVAHDINNSLAPLLTYSELLSGEADLPHQQREWLDMIRVGIADTAATVRRLDHFYRDPGNGETLEKVDLVELVEQTVELTRPQWQNAAQADGKQISVLLSFDERPFVNANPSQMRAAITNLIFNGIDAIQNEGTVRIDIQVRSEQVEIQVTDNGIGMADDQRNRCMEPFYTTKPQGSGLGLNETRGVIRQHNGTIAIQTEQNRGTTVLLTLPVAADEDASLPHHANLPTTPASVEALEPLVLYIDDDDAVRLSATALLNALGVTVHTAHDGPEGLRMLEQAEYGLVICDQGLPGMKGTEVVQEIKAKAPWLPVVIVSGWSMSKIPNEASADRYLKKPVPMEELQAVLHDFLPSARSV